MERAERGCCRACGAEVLLVRTSTGWRVELDCDPHPDGNVRLGDAGAAELTHEQVRRAKRAGSPLYVKHARSCPFAERRRT